MKCPVAAPSAHDLSVVDSGLEAVDRDLAAILRHLKWRLRRCGRQIDVATFPRKEAG